MQGAVTRGAELDSGFLGVSLELSSSEGWGGGLEEEGQAGRNREGGREEGKGGKKERGKYKLKPG